MAMPLFLSNASGRPRAAASGKRQSAASEDRTVVRKVQKCSTEAISTPSSGECGWTMVGPKEIMSMPGNFSPMIPHSSPAWMATISASRP